MDYGGKSFAVPFNKVNYNKHISINIDAVQVVTANYHVDNIYHSFTGRHKIIRLQYFYER